MTVLNPTPELIAAARKADGRDWTFDHNGPIELETNHILAVLVHVGYIRPHFVTPDAQIAGQDDYWALTDTGRAWLAEHDQEHTR